MKKLSAAQQRALDYIIDYTAQKSYPPSVREMCAALGLASTSSAHGLLSRLEKAGCIRRDPLKPRTIEILVPHAGSSADGVVELPLVGRVAAGVPITAVENIDDYYRVPAQLVGPGEHYMLSVKGESMIEAGIFDGDVVIVRRQDECENGDVVVALIDDEATVKTFYKEKGHIRLQPQNRTMEPIIVRDVAVLGKVVGLIRKMQ